MRLGINIDHVATLRNARGGDNPCPMRAAELVRQAGAELITIHLREDRRHIRDEDAARLIAADILPINLEMAATKEMLAFALEHRPYAVCIVPEKREELTTEGGLNVAGQMDNLAIICSLLKDNNIRTSLFVDPDEEQIKACAQVGAECVEIHTGSYAETFPQSDIDLAKIKKATELAHSLGLEVHAGHGLTYDNVGAVAAISNIKELNIGHFLIGDAIFIGLEASIKKMQTLIAAIKH